MSSIYDATYFYEKHLHPFKGLRFKGIPKSIETSLHRDQVVEP